MNLGKTERWDDRWKVTGICIFLAAIVWVVFGQTVHHEFVNFDDNDYVYENAQVSRGLTSDGLVWAFTHAYASNWHPLTWISHMLDCQLYGLNPGGHHLTNVLLHMTTAILLFLVVRRMTGFLWRSALVAAVFAVHPLRVESVAWVAERKDVLSGLFFVLTIGAYARYARHPCSLARYGLVMVLFALGLMSKPMLVTLPFVLLLLDYWPLDRFHAHDAAQPVFPFGGRSVTRGLILEKLPLIGLVAASCIVTLFAQNEAIASTAEIPLPARLGNALISYVIYIFQMLWPSHLAVLYPFPENGAPFWELILALVLLFSISIWAVSWRKKFPFLLAGWLWYLLMLLPVIGIIQVGPQAHADRYTYLPQIGLYLSLVWLVAELGNRWLHQRTVLGGLAAVILLALILTARSQTAYWQNSLTLWDHTITNTSGNFIAHYNFGDSLLKKGDADEAIQQYQTALQINPNYTPALENLANLLMEKGDGREAIDCYNRLIQLNPDQAITYYNLGRALFSQGRLDEAIVQFQKSLQLDPRHADTCLILGNACFLEKRLDDAILNYQKTLQLQPDRTEAHFRLGTALHQKGQVGEAISQFQQVLRIAPDYTEAQNSLAWILATTPDAALRDGRQAVELAMQANQTTGGANPIHLRTLAAAFAEAGQFDKAVQVAQRAIDAAHAASQQSLAHQLGHDLEHYNAGQPLHAANK